MRIVLLIFLYILLLITLPNITILKGNHVEVSYISDNIKIRAQSDNNLFNQVATFEERWKHSVDFINEYEILKYGKKYAEYAVVHREISNGGFVFLEINKLQDFNNEIHFSIQLDNNDKMKWSNLSDKQITMEHSNSIGVDRVQGPLGYFENNDLSVF